MRLSRLFGFEQSAFAFDAPAVAAERATGSDDAVTGDGECDGVGGAGASDGASGAWLAQFASELAVAAGLANWDLPQCIPDTKLKGSAAQVKWQIGCWATSLRVGNNLSENFA